MEGNSKFSLWKIGAANVPAISHTTKYLFCTVAEVEVNLCWIEGFDF